jgi:hypothetical protein
VPGESQLERSRAFAREEVARLLGIDVDPLQLADLAAGELGPQRVAHCLRLAARARLTRRAAATAHVATLVVGTRALGETWWTSTGDARLAAAGAGALEGLAARISDDCADERWGAPIGEVDLDDPRADDRVGLPAGACPGDTFVAAWDPGCRVVVDVVERDDGVGSILGDVRYDDTAEIAWAWGLAAAGAPLRLPGEVAGTPSDPFAVALDARAARRLRAWAGEREADQQRLGGAWRTRGDLWEAYHRLGLPYERDGSWHGFEILARAAVDGDPDEVGYALARLDMF